MVEENKKEEAAGDDSVKVVDKVDDDVEKLLPNEDAGEKSNGLKLEGLKAEELTSPTKVAESPLIRNRVNSVADDEWDTDSKARKQSIVV